MTDESQRCYNCRWPLVCDFCLDGLDTGLTANNCQYISNTSTVHLQYIFKQSGTVTKNAFLYKNVTVDYANGQVSNVNYIESGESHLPTLVLLHGFPSSSIQYHDLIPLLSNNYHILAPDMPGFGLTTVPSNFQYTFDNLATVMVAWLVALNISKYSVYIFDYGAPIGLRLALNAPSKVQAIVSQNGNAYVEGFGHPFWDPIMKLWETNSRQDRDYVRDNILTLDTTKFQYYEGIAEGDYDLVNPQAARFDYLQNLAGLANQQHQVDLFYDYRNNVAKYSDFQQYFRQSQVPLLAVWGENDPAFRPPGAEAFKRDLPKAEVHFVDSGHFALETKRWEIAKFVTDFLTRAGFYILSNVEWKLNLASYAAARVWHTPGWLSRIRKYHPWPYFYSH